MKTGGKQMNVIEKRRLGEKEKEELRNMIEETTSIYEFIQNNKLFKEWMHDSERFIGFTFIHTKNLLRHSITLTRLTRWLIGLTIGLVIVSLVHIVLIIISLG